MLESNLTCGSQACPPHAAEVQTILASASPWSQRYEGGPQSAEDLYRSWRPNVSTNITDIKLALYVKAFCLTDFVYLLSTDLEIFIRIFFGLFGMLTTPLSLYIFFKHKEFSSPSWIYHKAFNALDLPAMPFLIYQGIYWLFHLKSVKSVAADNFYSNIAEAVLYLMVMATTPMTFLISLERAIAVWKPLSFYKINRRWIAVSGCSLSAAFALIQLPKFGWYKVTIENSTTATENSSEIVVVTNYSDLALQPNFVVVGTACISIVTLLSIATTFTNIWLIIGVHRRSRQMRRRMSLSVRDFARTRQTSQISLLCMSISVPYLLCALFNMADKLYFWNYDKPGMNAIATLSFEEAMHHLACKQGSIICMTLFYLFSCIQHCCHFCFYYWLNSSFRSAVNELIFFRCYRKSKVAPEIELRSGNTKQSRKLRELSIQPPSNATIETILTPRM